MQIGLQVGLYYELSINTLLMISSATKAYLQKCDIIFSLLSVYPPTRTLDKAKFDTLAIRFSCLTKFKSVCEDDLTKFSVLF